MPRGRGHRGVRGHKGGAAAAAAAAADNERTSQAPSSSSSCGPHPALDRIPLIQCTMRFAASSMSRLVQLSEVNSTWNETVVSYGSVLSETALRAGTTSSAGASTDLTSSRPELRLKLYKSILLLPNFPFVFCHLVDVFVTAFFPLSITKSIPQTNGRNILFALCYRHCDLTEAQRAGRCMQLDHLLRRVPNLQMNVPLPAPDKRPLFVVPSACLRFGSSRSERHCRRSASALALLTPPWSYFDELTTPFRFAIDGRSDAEFLLLLVRAKKFRLSITKQHQRQQGASRVPAPYLFWCATAQNPVALKVLVETGIANKLVGYEVASSIGGAPEKWRERNGLSCAAYRFRCGYPLYVVSATPAQQTHRGAHVLRTSTATLNESLHGKQARVAHNTPAHCFDFAMHFFELLVPLYAEKAPACVAEAATILFGEDVRREQSPPYAISCPVVVAKEVDRDFPSPSLKQTCRMGNYGRYSEEVLNRARASMPGMNSGFWVSKASYHQSDSAVLELGNLLLRYIDPGSVSSALHSRSMSTVPFRDHYLVEIKKLMKQQKKHLSKEDDDDD